MYTVRRVAMHELSDFVAVLTLPERHASILAYVEHMFSQGAMRPEWCFLVEKEGEALGRAAFWTLPGKDVPSDIVLLDPPWEDDACGDQLWQDLLLMCKQLGAEQLGYVLDTPAMAPQWQESGPTRQTFLKKKGFHLQRETSRFEWKSDEPRSQEANGGILFRSLSEVGEASFIDAIMRGPLPLSTDRLRKNVPTSVPISRQKRSFTTCKACLMRLIGGSLPIRQRTS